MKHQVYHSIDNEVFHVHTRRCNHAEDVADEEYVKKAIEIGAKRIVFSDHCPFPGDIFTNRMKMEELPGYIESCRELKEKYENEIEVLCALEVEYVPEFLDYYNELKANNGIDFLVLGQHFYKHDDGSYSFSDVDQYSAFKGLGEAIVEGINTGLFDVVAHPDRIFRKCFIIDEEEIKIAKQIVWAAAWNGVYLEINKESLMTNRYYKPEFWDLVPPKALVLKGMDAHSIKEIEWF